MKFKDIVGRITGFNCPIFGINWTPPEGDQHAARNLISFLEDKRVLYVPDQLEVPRHCVESVFDIRERLNHELEHVPSDSSLREHLRAMRAACRKFLTAVPPEITEFGHQHGHYANWIFGGALGELRGVFGVHIAAIAQQHGLDVEDDLAAILPERPVDEDSHHHDAKHRGRFHR